jgi:hypothetical protein
VILGSDDLFDVDFEEIITRFEIDYTGEGLTKPDKDNAKELILACLAFKKEND